MITAISKISIPCNPRRYIQMEIKTPTSFDLSGEIAYKITYKKTEQFLIQEGDKLEIRFVFLKVYQEGYFFEAINCSNKKHFLINETQCEFDLKEIQEAYKKQNELVCACYASYVCFMHRSPEKHKVFEVERYFDFL